MLDSDFFTSVDIGLALDGIANFKRITTCINVCNGECYNINSGADIANVCWFLTATYSWEFRILSDWYLESLESQSFWTLMSWWLGSTARDRCEISYVPEENHFTLRDYILFCLQWCNRTIKTSSNQQPWLCWKHIVMYRERITKKPVAKLERVLI